MRGVRRDLGSLQSLLRLASTEATQAQSLPSITLLVCQFVFKASNLEGNPPYPAMLLGMDAMGQ